MIEYSVHEADMKLYNSKIISQSLWDVPKVMFFHQTTTIRTQAKADISVCDIKLFPQMWSISKSCEAIDDGSFIARLYCVRAAKRYDWKCIMWELDRRTRQVITTCLWNKTVKTLWEIIQATQPVTSDVQSAAFGSNQKINNYLIRSCLSQESAL